MHCSGDRMLTVVSATTLSGDIMDAPPPFDPVTVEVVDEAVGLVHEYFMKKIEASNGEQLVEDDELPIKHRFPKPRLPPTGRITSPRKRPVREQQMMARKRRKLEEGREEVIGNNGVSSMGTMGTVGTPKPIGKLKLDVPPTAAPVGDPEKEDDATGMMSPPESL
jgi:transcriptional activator SPT7